MLRHRIPIPSYCTFALLRSRNFVFSKTTTKKVWVIFSSPKKFIAVLVNVAKLFQLFWRSLVIFLSLSLSKRVLWCWRETGYVCIVYNPVPVFIRLVSFFSFIPGKILLSVCVGGGRERKKRRICRWISTTTDKNVKWCEMECGTVFPLCVVSWCSMSGEKDMLRK